MSRLRRPTAIDASVAMACGVAVYWFPVVVVLAAIVGGGAIGLALWMVKTALGEHREGDGSVGLTGFLVLYATCLAVLGVHLISHTLTKFGE